MKFIILIFLLIPIKSFSQYNDDVLKTFQKYQKKNDDTIVIEKKQSKTSNPSKRKKKEKDLTWTVIYYNLSNNILKYRGENYKSFSQSLGYQKMKSFYHYGFEYQYIKQQGVTKINNASLTMGLQPEWHFGYIPYVNYKFGLANISDSELEKDLFGYNQSFEIGVFLKRIAFFHIITGMRYNFITTESTEIDEIKSQELFLRVGIEF